MNILFLLAYTQSSVLIILFIAFAVLFFINVKRLSKFTRTRSFKFLIIAFIISSTFLFLFNQPSTNILDNNEFVGLIISGANSNGRFPVEEIDDKKFISSLTSTINRYEFVKNPSRTFDGELITDIDATRITLFEQIPTRIFVYIFDSAKRKSMVRINGLVYEVSDSHAFNSEIIGILKTNFK